MPCVVGVKKEKPKSMKKAYGKERKTSHLAFRRTTDRSIEWSSWSSSREQLLIMCVYGYVCINDTWQMVTLYHRSHKSLTLCVAPKYVSRFCELSKKFKLRQEKELCKKRRHEGFLLLQKLLNWNKRHKQRWTNGSKQKNRDIWDSKKRKNAKTKNRKQRKQMEKSTNWSRAPTAQPSFSGPASSLSFPAIGNKTKNNTENWHKSLGLPVPLGLANSASTKRF